MENTKKCQIVDNKSNKLDPLLDAGFSGDVIVEFAPISDRMWSKGDTATIRNNQIRLGGCWFNFDDRYIVKVVPN